MENPDKYYYGECVKWFLIGDVLQGNTFFKERVSANDHDHVGSLSSTIQVLTLKISILVWRRFKFKKKGSNFLIQKLMPTFWFHELYNMNYRIFHKDQNASETVQIFSNSAKTIQLVPSLISQHVHQCVCDSIHPLIWHGMEMLFIAWPSSEHVSLWKLVLLIFMLLAWPLSVSLLSSNISIIIRYYSWSRNVGSNFFISSNVSALL